MSAVETAFSTPRGTSYLQLDPQDLPRVGELVRFTGKRATEYGAFTVAEVCRVYELADTDTNDELVHVFVSLAPVEKTTSG